MYDVFLLMGFGIDMLKWIKLFNTEISARVLQAGVMSEFFTIQRGCKQGDAIASIEFIVCAQILYLIINNNIDIKVSICAHKINSIIFGNEEVKMSQFADDTTLTLDGTQKSLQDALNTL